MKKIKLLTGILSLIMVFCLAACNTDEVINDNVSDGANEVINDNISEDANNQQQESVEQIDSLKNMTFEERTKELSNLLEMKKNLKYADEYYFDSVIENVSIEKIENHYLLRADVMHPVSFTKAEIDAVVNEIENNKLETAKLGKYTVYRTLPSNVEEWIFDEIKNSDWLSENGIPTFIRSDREGWAEWLMMEKKENTDDEYVLYYYPMAGGFERFIEMSDETADKVEIKLLSNDKIAVLEGGEPSFREEPYEVLTVQEYYNKAINGDISNENIRYDINDMSETTFFDDELTLENGMICIYQVNEGV